VYTARIQTLDVLQPLVHTRPLDDQGNYADIVLLLCDEARRSVRPTAVTVFFNLFISSLSHLYDQQQYTLQVFSYSIMCKQ
jgi:hypothetical protein